MRMKLGCRPASTLPERPGQPRVGGMRSRQQREFQRAGFGGRGSPDERAHAGLFPLFYLSREVTFILTVVGGVKMSRRGSYWLEAKGGDGGF